MSDSVYSNFKRHFPLIADSAAKIYPGKRLELIAELDDGRRILYDDLEGAIRRLPRDDKNLTEDECRSEFGWRLRRLMLIKCISQQELSEATGIPQPALSRYMNGVNIPSFHKADLIAKAMGCSIDEFRYLVEE